MDTHTDENMQMESDVLLDIHIIHLTIIIDHFEIKLHF